MYLELFQICLGLQELCSEKILLGCRGGAAPGATSAVAPVHQPCAQEKLGDI
jgi:hypothetical protein